MVKQHSAIGLLFRRGDCEACCYQGQDWWRTNPWGEMFQTARDLYLVLRFMFQQDNDPKHMEKNTEEWLKNKKVIILEWPSQSLDLKSVVWPEKCFLCNLPYLEWICMNKQEKIQNINVQSSYRHTPNRLGASCQRSIYKMLTLEGMNFLMINVRLSFSCWIDFIIS